MKRPFTKPGLLSIDPRAWGLSFSPFDPAPAKLFDVVGDAAIVRVSGPLTQHDECSWWGCDNYDAIKARVAAALESSAKAVVLHIDSPGGDAAGCCETGQWIRDAAAAAGKKVISFTDGLAASAGYALACAADGGIFLAASARVGSIGTLMVSVDQSAMDQQFGLRFSVVTSGVHKADGNPHVPVTEEARAEMQAQVNTYAGMFFAHVAAMRPGLSVDAIRALEARVFIGAAAVEAGIADQVTTFDALLAMVANGGNTTELSRAKEAAEKMTFEEMLAELKEKAQGEGEEAEKAQKMLKAIESEEEPKAEGEDEEEKPASSKKGATDEDEEEEPSNAAAGNAAGDTATVATLSASIQKLTKELASLKGTKAADDRRALLKTVPGLPKALVDVVLKTNKTGAFVTPMSSVRAIIDSAPKAPAKKVTTAAAATTAAATGAAGQGGNILGGVTRASKEADELDVRFGLKSEAGGITRDGSAMVFKTMTPDEARAHIAAKKAAAGAAGAGK